MKKFFTLLAASLLAFGASAADLEDQKTELLYWPQEKVDGEMVDVTGTVGGAEIDGVMGSNNFLKYNNGLSITLQRSDKSYSSAKAIEINGENYTTIKLSNGAINTLAAPEGYVINKITLYSYINFNRVDKGSDGRVCYWKQVGETEYTEENATILKDYTDIEGYQATPDKVEFELPNLSSVIFKNIGEQLCFVVEVTYGKLPVDGISSVEADAEEGAMYNIQGVRVDNNYRGLIIMNGKKYINR